MDGLVDGWISSWKFRLLDRLMSGWCVCERERQRLGVRSGATGTDQKGQREGKGPELAPAWVPKVI